MAISILQCREETTAQILERYAYFLVDYHCHRKKKLAILYLKWNLRKVWIGQRKHSRATSSSGPSHSVRTSLLTDITRTLKQTKALFICASAFELLEKLADD
jgi:hypothetical protein